MRHDNFEQVARGSRFRAYAGKGAIGDMRAKLRLDLLGSRVLDGQHSGFHCAATPSGTKSNVGSLPRPIDQLACIRTLGLGAHHISPEVERGHPEQIVFGSIVDHGKGHACTFFSNHDRKRWIELREHESILAAAEKRREVGRGAG